MHVPIKHIRYYSISYYKCNTLYDSGYMYIDTILRENFSFDVFTFNHCHFTYICTLEMM